MKQFGKYNLQTGNIDVVLVTLQSIMNPVFLCDEIVELALSIIDVSSYSLHRYICTERTIAIFICDELRQFFSLLSFDV